MGAIGSFQEAARAGRWKSPEQPGRWVKVTRTFRDDSSQDWWALEVVTGPYGPSKKERVVIATTDPITLPDVTTSYLVTNLPAPASPQAAESPLATATLQEVVRLYSLRMWVEQSYKHVKHTLGWSQYQVRSDRAIRRHWQLVCCAFSFCWYHASHPAARMTQEAQDPSELGVPPPQQPSVPVDEEGTGEKISEGKGMRPQMSWPRALRAVRGWLEPWIMLRRYWHGWSQQPPPLPLQLLLTWLEQGQAINLYSSA